MQNQGVGHGPMVSQLQLRFVFLIVELITLIMDEQAMMGPAHRSTVDELSAKYMVPIRRAVFSCFMLRDGEYINLLIDSTLAEHTCSYRRYAYYNVCDPV